MGAPFWVPFAQVLRGWARHQQGERQAGWANIRAGLKTLQATERSLFKPYLLGLQAELHAQAGEPEQGLALIKAALRVMQSKAERWCESELSRLEGELLLLAGQPEPAAASLRHSLATARAQRARSLELRAALTLARHWPDQGRRALADALAWFAGEPAGLEVREARDLLTRL
jgi:predicted ATPase